MANEFKIKTGLLLGPSPTQPVVSVQNASTSIVSDASSILVTGKAIYDYVNAKTGSSTLAGLSDVAITNLSTNQFLRYNYTTSKWENVSPVEASLYFWPLSTALLRESSIGTGFNWNAGMLNVSTGTTVYAGLGIKDVSGTFNLKITETTAVGNEIPVKIPTGGNDALYIDSINIIQDNNVAGGGVFNGGGHFHLKYVPNQSLVIDVSDIIASGFATNASIGLAGFATNSSVNLALGAYATNASIGLAGFATNASVNIALGKFIRSASTGFGLYWNGGMLDVSVTGSGTGLSTIEVSSNYTALSNYIILANSSYNAFNITLPLSPVNGDIVAVVDVMKSSSTNNINILRNGHLINKLSENFTIDVNGGGVQLIYHSLDNNFAIQNLETLVGYINSSTAGGGGVSQAYVDGSFAYRDASINLLFLQIGDISTALGAILG